MTTFKYLLLWIQIYAAEKSASNTVVAIFRPVGFLAKVISRRDSRVEIERFVCVSYKAHDLINKMLLVESHYSYWGIKINFIISVFKIWQL